MNQAVRIGLLGCGRAAERLHVPAVGPSTGTRLAGVYDPIHSRRELLASRQDGCRTFDSAASLVESGAVDAVIVATPPETHADIVTLALRAGLPVLVEKPLAGSVAQGRDLQAVQQALGGMVMVGLNRRWWEPVLVLRECLSSTQTAPPEVRMEIASDVRAWSALSAGSDPLDDLGTHQLDLLRFITRREIESIQASRPSANEYHMRIRLEDNITATCAASYRSPSRESIEVKAGGRHYCVRVGSERLTPASGILRRALDAGDAVQRRVLRRRGGLARSYSRQLRAFVACVRGGELATPGIRDGLAAMNAIEAVRNSLAAGGAAITVPRIDTP